MTATLSLMQRAFIVRRDLYGWLFIASCAALGCEASAEQASDGGAVDSGVVADDAGRQRICERSRWAGDDATLAEIAECTVITGDLTMSAPARRDPDRSSGRYGLATPAVPQDRGPLAPGSEPPMSSARIHSQ